MIILGIDPGSGTTGFGLVRYDRNTYQTVALGAINTSASQPVSERLKIIFLELQKLIATNSPDACAVETAFYGKNAQSLIKLAQARAMALLAAGLNNLPVTEYSPRDIKMSVTGNGAASKDQVQFMTQRILGLKSPPKPKDASDALAVALCHAQRVRFNQK